MPPDKGVVAILVFYHTYLVAFYLLRARYFALSVYRAVAYRAFIMRRRFINREYAGALRAGYLHHVFKALGRVYGRFAHGAERLIAL